MRDDINNSTTGKSQPRSVFLVEDEAEARNSMRILLGHAGYVIHEAADGLQALDKLLELQTAGCLPDLLIADVRMPRMNGVQLLSELSERKINLPVLVITGYGTKQLVADLLRLGCVGYLDKPFTPDELMAGIADVLDRAHGLQSDAALPMRVGGVAHDLKNMLHVAGGNLELLRPLLDGHSEALEIVGDAERAVAKAVEVSQQLMLTARGQTSVRSTMRLNELVDDAMAMAGQWEGIRRVVDLPEGLWRISANRIDLARALRNILFNACEAMPSGGVLTVRAENMTPNGTLRFYDGPAYVHLEVADTGCGMPADGSQLFFRPGFSTKPRGSGMGLYVTHEIVTQHGGYVSVRPGRPQGTVVDLFLPALIESEARVTAVTAVSERPRVLLVAPADDTTGELTRLLEQSGYTVNLLHDAGDTLYAYEVAVRAGRPFAAVILGLPGEYDGLVKRLRGADPGVRMILAGIKARSGAVDGGWDPRAVLDATHQLLAG